MRPPANAIRSSPSAALVSVSSSDVAGPGATLYGMFAQYGSWSVVRSPVEGTFIESIDPGAFARTIAHDRSRLRVIYDHGQDHLLGRRPLGLLTELAEDQRGAFYSVQLFDTLAARELLPGLRAGIFGSSFNMHVSKDSFNPYAKRSAANPEGLPERRVIEASIIELGPTPFPVYSGTSASVRAASRAVSPSRHRRFRNDDEWLRHLARLSR